MDHKLYLSKCQSEKIGYIASQLRTALSLPYDAYLRQFIIRSMMRIVLADESYRHYINTGQETQWSVAWLHARKFQIPSQDLPDGVCLKLQPHPTKPKKDRKKKDTDDAANKRDG